MLNKSQSVGIFPTDIKRNTKFGICSTNIKQITVLESFQQTLNETQKVGICLSDKQNTVCLTIVT